MTGRAGRGRRFEVPPAASVLTELYADPEPEPVAETPPPAPIPATEPAPPQRGPKSAEGRNGVQHEAEQASTSGGRRTPDGMTRHTIYVSKVAAGALDAAVDGLHRDLGGMLPRHRILAELIAAAVAATPQVRRQLRADLLAALADDTDPA